MDRRDPAAVIKAMVDQCPPDAEIRRSLKRWLFASCYSTPERDNYIWQKLGNILEAQLAKPVEPWEFEVLSIFTTRSVADIQALLSKDEGCPDATPST